MSDTKFYAMATSYREEHYNFLGDHMGILNQSWTMLYEDNNREVTFKWLNNRLHLKIMVDIYHGKRTIYLANVLSSSTYRPQYANQS